MSLSLFSHSQHDRPHSSVLKRINDINANEIVWHQRFLKFNVINSAWKCANMPVTYQMWYVICDLKLLSRNRFALKPTRPINKVHARTKNKTNVQYRIFSSVHACSVQACSNLSQCQYSKCLIMKIRFYHLWRTILWTKISLFPMDVVNRIDWSISVIWHARWLLNVKNSLLDAVVNTIHFNYSNSVVAFANYSTKNRKS